jgi:hypothetical protein
MVSTWLSVSLGTLHHSEILSEIMTVTTYAAYAVLRLYGIFHGGVSVFVFIRTGQKNDSLVFQILLRVILGRIVSH